MNIWKKIFGGLLLTSIVFGLGWVSADYHINKKLPTFIKSDVKSTQTQANTDKNSEKTDLTVFWKVWSLLQEMYVDETALDPNKMAQGAVKGMVAAIGDPFTVYMTPDETKEFEDSLNGQLEGIGAELTIRNQSLVVVSPLKNSPAEKAGVLSGDIVFKIDGQLTSEMTLFEAITKIRGPKGTKVTLTLVRKNVKEPLDLSITRETVNVESVTLKDKGDGIYQLGINQFNETTKPELDEKIKQLLLADTKGIILDLRNNGGGYLDTAVELLSEFLPANSEAVTIKRKKAKDDETLKVSGKPRLPKLPIVVLINGGSASASEIVAGAIKDLKRGVLLGEKSFGKGSVQEVTPLNDGSSLRVTIARWYTPAGNNIDKVGITPDIEVKVSEDDLISNKDPQLDAAFNYIQKQTK